MATKAAGDGTKPRCKYWEKCFRKEKGHLAQFLHQRDMKEEEEVEESSQEAETIGGVNHKTGDALSTPKKQKLDLSGKKVVIAGTFKKMTEKVAAARARGFGCVICDTVGDDVDIVVLGKDAGKKGEKAKELGLRILTEENWEGLISRARPSSTKKSKKSAAAATADDTDDTDTDVEMASPKPQKKKKDKQDLSELKRQRTHVLSDDSDGEGTSNKYKPRRTRSGTLLGGATSSKVKVANSESDMDTSDENDAVVNKTKVKRQLSNSAETPSPKRQKSTTKAASAESKTDASTSKASPSKNSPKKIAKCKYWEKCYRKEAGHLATFLHPSDDPDDLDDGTHTLSDGEEAEVEAGTRKYHIKRTGETYYCNCVGWKTQNKGVDKRTCCHLKEYLGEATECARVGTKPKVATANKGGAATIFRTAKHKSVSLLLAHKYTDGTDPTGWWISEKLDGVRAYWDGKTFYSRLGNEFIPPPDFIKNYPRDLTLDGELFGGRALFQSTVAIVKNAGSDRWKEIEYHIFDAPSIGSKPFEERIQTITDYFKENESETAVVVTQKKCTGRQMIAADLEKVETLGGEGLMIREPGSKYEQRRSHTLLKIKNFYDAEARVIGYDPGKGRNAGRVGALRCEMECGKKFSVGSGLSDKERARPPKIGSIITYKFQEYTNSGSPRFPTFVGVRIDASGPKDAVLPAGKAKTGDE